MGDHMEKGLRPTFYSFFLTIGMDADCFSGALFPCQWNRDKNNILNWIFVPFYLGKYLFSLFHEDSSIDDIWHL